MALNEPDLPNGAVAIKWDENNVEVETTNTDSKWYDYIAQTTTTENGGTSKWANCKLEDGSYFVWIPRYAYKIDSTNQTIDVKFTQHINGTELSYDKSSLDGYIVHPAFTNNVEAGGWDSELPGIWVAKYEAGIPNSNGNTGDIEIPLGNRKSPVFKPNRKAYDVPIGVSYSLAKEYNSNLNSHMMKNSEWGAVAYLTHSQYGRNGTEITINNSISLITGNAGNTIYASKSSGVTNAYDTKKGTLASTTGNIYGIYDLSGGATEFIAGYINNNDRYLRLMGESLVNDGNTGTSTKYKTVYAYDTTSDTNTNNYNVAENKVRVGEAIWETSTSGSGNTSWKNDSSYFPCSGSPFMVRGGSYSSSTRAGIFAISSHTGYQEDRIELSTNILLPGGNGFRVVLVN